MRPMEPLTDPSADGIVEVGEGLERGLLIVWADTVRRSEDERRPWA
jgi:hypothetical protein